MVKLGPRQGLVPGLLVFLALLVQPVVPLYFYFELGESKCFMEELPVETILVGHYLAEEWNDKHENFEVPDDLDIGLVVRHIHSEHVLVSSRGPAEGKFAFTSHEAGDHEICIQTEYKSDRIFSGHPPTVRMHLDVVIGDSHRSTSEADRSHSHDLFSRTQALNTRMRDLRKEQQFQREREAEFRNLSEAVNSRAMRWMWLQIFVLVAACLWQVRHLKVYFEDKKYR